MTDAEVFEAIKRGIAVLGPFLERLSDVFPAQWAALAVVRKTLPKFRRCLANVRAEKSFRRFMRLRSELQHAVYTATKESSQWAEEYRTPAREMFRAGAFLDDVERRAFDVYTGTL